MPEQFDVDLGVLDDAATAISRSVYAMSKCEVEDIVGPSPQYGHDGLHGAFEYFCEMWQDGVELLLEDSDTISSALNGAVESYMNRDQSAKTTFHTHGTGRDPAVDTVDG